MQDRTEQVTKSLVSVVSHNVEPENSKRPNSVAIQIRGITVHFPKEPYPCQIEYMDKAIEALKERSNALLESPTGTGKTLCLLCSALAWQVHDTIVNPRPSPMPGSTAAAPVGGNKSIIIYATRTHSQLQQVISELRQTAYRPKMSILGSRDQLCVHEKISKLKGSSLNHACNTTTSKHGCMYRNNIDGFSDGNVDNEVLDIEDLVLVGKKKKICPYYYSRDTSAAADILFMPYNYLLDNAVRRTMKINFESSIVIFDEAHNLEKVAADSASFTITSTDIAACIKELQKVLQRLKEEEVASRSQDKPSSSSSSKTVFDFDSTVEKPTLVGTAGILQSLFRLESELDNVSLSSNVVNSSPGAKFPGRWLVDVFHRSGFQNPEIIDEVNRCMKYLMDIDNDEMKRVGVDSVSSSSTSIPKLEILGKAIERIFRSIGANANDYKVYIHENESKKVWNRVHSSDGAKKKRVINFWCFTTGVALRELVNLGVRSVIVTSGTLSPINALKEDFQIPFPIVLQNPHIISNHQIVVSALSQGITGISLNSSFENRKSTTYVDELGNTIIGICDSLVLKDRDPLTPFTEGGVLIFFPSYTVMEETIERWKFVGIFDRMKTIMKSVIIEPRAGSGKESTSKENTKQIQKKASGFMVDDSAGKRKTLTDDLFDDNEISEETFQSIVEEFDRSVTKNGRCLMIGVCRGKVSEGIDFSDNKGRAVILTGIPFAPHMDPWVRLKREYLDERTSMQSQVQTIPTPTISKGPEGMIASSSYINVAVPSSIVSNTSATNPWLQAKLAASANSVPSSSTNGIPAESNPSSMAAASSAHSKSNLTGQMWYQQSASRAVNQALGRVIRHKNDWGAIFLLDERFQYEINMNQLSSWMRPCIRKSNNAKVVLQEFTEFLRRVNLDPKLRYDPSAYVTNRIESSVPRSRPIVRTRLAFENAPESDPFQKFIEVSATQLEQGNEDQFFISKDMIVRSGEYSGNKITDKKSMTEEELRAWELMQEANKISSITSVTSNAKDLQSLLTAKQQDRNTSIIKSATAMEPSLMLPPAPPLRIASTVSGYRNSTASASAAASESALIEVDLSNKSTDGGDYECENDGEAAETQSLTIDEDEAVTSAVDYPSNESNLFLSQSQRTQTSELSNAGSATASRFGLGSSRNASLGSFSEKKTMSQAQTQPLPVPASTPTVDGHGAINHSQLSSSSGFSMTQRLQALSKVSSIQKVKEERSRQISLEIKNFCDEAQQHLPEHPMIELRRFLESWHSRGGLRGIAQLHPFQSELLALVDGNLQYDVPLSLKKLALVTMQCLVSDASLMNSYETVAKQLMTGLLKRSRDAMEATAKGNANVTSSVALSHANASSSAQQSSSLLAQAAARKVQAANAAARVSASGILGGENVDNLGSKRAKLLLQLGKANPQPGSSTTTRPSHAEGSAKPTEKVSLLDKLKEFDRSENSLITGSKKFSQQPQQQQNKRITNVKCSICMEEDDPLRAQCGHVCCKSCWMKQFKMRSVCPICRTATDTSQLARIRVAASSSSSSSSLK